VSIRKDSLCLPRPSRFKHRLTAINESHPLDYQLFRANTEDSPRCLENPWHAARNPSGRLKDENRQAAENKSF
jgi:hypothetical protein